MLSIENPQINYDSKFDIVYYICGDTTNSYGDEDLDNIIVLKDIDSDEIMGYTIMNFKRICINRTKEYGIISHFFDVDKVMEVCGF